MANNDINNMICLYLNKCSLFIDGNFNINKYNLSYKLIYFVYGRFTE